MHDRDYYRALPIGVLLNLAVEEGINPEMAIALAEGVAELLSKPRMVGRFTFNHEGGAK